jgi:SH3-like domain-containing protein
MTRPCHFASLLIIPLLMLAGDAAALCVTSSQANLRSGPGTRYQKTWEVYKFMPLQQIARKGSWYRVKDVDGDRHWIHKSLVSKRIKCAVVKGARANVRTGPGTKYQKAHWSPAETYYSFKTVGTSGRWLKVVDEVGNSGWIANSLVWRR